MGAHFINVYVSHNVKFLTNKVTMPFADASNCISAGPNVRAHHITVRSAPKPIPVLSPPVYAPPVVRSPAVYGGGYGGGDVRPMSSGGTIAGVIVAILVIGGLIFLGVFGSHKGWYTSSSGSSYSSGSGYSTNHDVVEVQTKEHPAIGTWIGHPFNTTVTAYNQTSFTWSLNPATGRLGWSTDVRRRLVLRVEDGKLDQIKF